MNPRLLGLHHVTATVDEAQPDLDFYTGILGLRLVKKTVNFDNQYVYHFYYADERGTPGTIMTTFPYHGHGVRRGIIGTGQVSSTAFSIPAGSAGFWGERIEQRGLRVIGESERFGDRVQTLLDPSGLVTDLVETSSDARPAFTGAGIGRESACRGIHSVSLSVRDWKPTLRLLADVLGLSVIGSEGERTRLIAGRDAAGCYVDLLHEPDGPEGINGLGTVHHVALAIGTPEEQIALREDLLERDFRVTEVRDRKYFRSIYFREPGGVLIEVATVGPGFAVDETLDALGTGLKLPDQFEEQRAEIEAQLAPVKLP
jgi:glyoxalase family protein